MEFFSRLYDLLRHLGDDAKWKAVIDYVGTTNLYIALFAVVFAETGLVITPFLPGDSLLFFVGAMGMRDVGLNLWILTPLLIVAAVVGDAVNYAIGYKLGPKVFRRDDAAAQDPTRKKKFTDRLLNKKHLDEAHAFYEKYGPKTIILARFVPVVRTFAPFVAGIGKMSYFKFALYNIVGGVAWVLICVGAGMFFGQYEVVKKNFELVAIAIVVVSVLPMAIEFIRAKRAAKREAQRGFPMDPVGSASADAKP